MDLVIVGIVALAALVSVFVGMAFLAKIDDGSLEGGLQGHPSYERWVLGEAALLKRRMRQAPSHPRWRIVALVVVVIIALFVMITAHVP